MPGVDIAREPFDAPDGAALRAAMEREMVERYGADLKPGAKPTAADVAVFLVACDGDRTAVGCGALRRLDGETVEVKRMYVRPAARGLGAGRALLAALEAEARALGATCARLETGPGQPEALGLYESAGYRPIPCWGAYAELDGTLCFERALTPS